MTTLPSKIATVAAHAHPKMLPDLKKGYLFRGNVYFLKKFLSQKNILLFQENIRKMPNPEIGLLDRYSDGKCDNLTLVNSLNKMRMKCLHSKSMRTTLEGSHKLERQSMSRSTHNNIGRSMTFGERLVPTNWAIWNFGK